MSDSPSIADLQVWVRERMENCERIAERKIGADRNGWLDDAKYFRAILTYLGRLTIILYQLEMLSDR